MNVFIKDKVRFSQNSTRKVNWISSISQNYREKIFSLISQENSRKVKNKNEVTLQYQVIVDLTSSKDEELNQEKAKIKDIKVPTNSERNLCNLINLERKKERENQQKVVFPHPPISKFKPLRQIFTKQ